MRPPIARVPAATTALPPPRRCPRCRTGLEHERTFVSKGLTGVPSTEHRYVCPACDARYRWSSRDERWKELS